MQRKKRISIVISWPMFNKVGGTERVLANFCNAMVNKGYDITVYSSDTELAPFLFSVDPSVKFIPYGMPEPSYWYSERGIKLRTCFILNKQKRRDKRKLYERLALSSMLKRKIKLTDTDLFVTFSIYSTYILKKIIGDKIDIPIVTMIHTHIDSALEEMFPSGIPRSYKQLKEIKEIKNTLSDFVETVSTSDFIQVLRPEYVSQVQEVFKGTKIIYIPNTVPQYSVSSKLTEKTVINVGRICQSKRQHLLVEAFSIVSKKHPDWKLEFYGDIVDYSYKSYIDSLITKYKLEDKVFILGSTSLISEKLQKSSIFAFPTKFEGFPLALTEAMSMGLPAIGCINCPSVNTLIKNGHNGFLCNDNAADMAETLSILMENFNLRLQLGHCAKQDMKEYDPSIIWNKWDFIIKSLID